MGVSISVRFHKIIMTVSLVKSDTVIWLCNVGSSYSGTEDPDDNISSMWSWRYLKLNSWKKDLPLQEVPNCSPLLPMARSTCSSALEMMNNIHYELYTYLISHFPRSRRSPPQFNVFGCGRAISILPYNAGLTSESWDQSSSKGTRLQRNAH